MTSDVHQPTVGIVGAGLAGLSCAVSLSEVGINVRIFEGSDRVGGRIRTDVVDGFSLDHGFQVLLTAYPACRQLLDYAALRLQPFEPGALVRHQGSFAMLGDPWRRPSQAINTLLSPVGTFADKWKVAKLRRQASRGSLEELFAKPNQSAQSRLEQDGFSAEMIAQFFRPFIGGVFLDPELETSSRMLEFVFRMFAAGDIAIPADGMAAIPRQLAERLPRGSIALSQSVESITDGVIQLTSGEQVRPQRIVVATESSAASRLTGSDLLNTKWRTTTNHYFTADRSPDSRRLLMLAGDEYRRDGAHRLGSVTVLSDIASSYAPQGKCLISVSLAETANDVDASPTAELTAVRMQLLSWFGDQVKRWEHIRTYRIPYGLPIVPLAQIDSFKRVGNVLVCGDYLSTPSIHGALSSGIKAAEVLVKELGNG